MYEGREFVLVPRENAIANKLDYLKSRIDASEDRDGTAPVSAVESSVADVNARLQRVRSVPLSLCEVKDLEPLVAPALAMLTIEPTAEVSIRSY